MKRFYGMRGQSKSGKDTAAQLIIEYARSQSRSAAAISLAGPLKDFAAHVFNFSHDQLYGPSESRDATDPRYKEVTSIEWIGAYNRFLNYGRSWLLNVLLTAQLMKEETENAHWIALQKWFVNTHVNGKPTARYVLQTLGTEFGREQLHPEVWLKYTWQKMLDLPVDHAVLTDIRFVNEAKFFSEHGVEVWRVMRPGATGESAMTAGVANHKSEMDQKSYDIMQYDKHALENDGTLDDLRERVAALLQKGD